MTGLKQQITCVGSDRFTDCATTTAQFLLVQVHLIVKLTFKFNLEKLWQLLEKILLVLGLLLEKLWQLLVKIWLDLEKS